MVDVCKALNSFHANNIVHGGVKPTGMYLNAGNEVILGEFRKSELDALRQTHQLMSRSMAKEAIPTVLIYWAPELLSKGGSPSVKSDMWALGVTL